MDTRVIGCSNELLVDMILNTLDNVVGEDLLRQVTSEEVKKAMFNIDGDEAPGPDGYTSQFFKSCWSIVGKEVTEAILYFFLNKRYIASIQFYNCCLSS